MSTVTSCPTRSAAEERSLKRGLLPPHGRIRRGPEGSSRKVDVRRRWDPRVEKTTRTPYLEEMPITTEATSVHPNKCHYDCWASDYWLVWGPAIIVAFIRMDGGGFRGNGHLFQAGCPSRLLHPGIPPASNVDLTTAPFRASPDSTVRRQQPSLQRALLRRRPGRAEC